MTTTQTTPDRATVADRLSFSEHETLFSATLGLRKLSMPLRKTHTAPVNPRLLFRANLLDFLAMASCVR
jgi:hypothetical protein